MNTETQPFDKGTYGMSLNRPDKLPRLSSDLFLVVGRDGAIREASGASRELTGLAPADLQGVTLTELFFAEDRAAVLGLCESLVAGAETGGLDGRVCIHGGGHRWCSCSATFDRGRQVFLVFLRDIQEHRERESFSKLFFESASVGLNLCKMDGTWMESNPAFLRMIGYSREEADGGLTYWQLTPKKYDDAEQVQLSRLRQEGRYGPYEKEFIRKDGTLIPVRLNGFIIAKDNEPYIWSIIEDISRETELKSEIARKTRLFEAIVDNVPTPLFVKDASRGFEYVLWNRAAEDSFEIKRDSVIGKRDEDLWVREHADLYHKDDQAVLHAGRLVDIPEEPFQTKGRGLIYVHTKKVPLAITDDGEPSLLLGISENITDRKKMEEDLRAAIGVRDEFLSIASHELKTPFTALDLQLQLLHKLLRNGGPVDPQLGLLAQKAKDSSRQMAALLNELLDIAKIRAGRLTLKKKSVDLRAATETAIGMVSEELSRSGSSVRVSAGEGVEGFWDPGRINQVISNLLSNAAKYGLGNPIEVKISADPSKGVARLEVTDQGMGIPPELHETIFRRFERGVSGERISGLGLGLYIVREIVEAHQGSIRVESALGKGAHFVVELPLKAEA